MAIKLIASYGKKAGLPGFSSHLFTISVEKELSATDDIPAESERLYQMLQSNVDRQMQSSPGFVPPKEYGLEVNEPNNVIRHQPGETSNVNLTNLSGSWLHGPSWNCSEKQMKFILNLVDEHHLTKEEVEELSLGRFGKGVTLLAKSEASRLIDELLKLPKNIPHQSAIQTTDEPASDRTDERMNAA
jgi:hypothetical protein